MSKFTQPLSDLHLGPWLKSPCCYGLCNMACEWPSMGGITKTIEISDRSLCDLSHGYFLPNIPQTEFTIAPLSLPLTHSDASTLHVSSLLSFSPNQSPKPDNWSLNYLSYLFITRHPFCHSLSVGPHHFLPRLMPQPWNPMSCSSECTLHMGTNQRS